MIPLLQYCAKVTQANFDALLDDHEIMIIETFGVLNNQVFIEISEY